MNYQAHYDRLIERARHRVLEGYRERHHVLPRCLGGGDDSKNLVELTAEEHYVAHQLLVKIHPADGRLAHAAVRMARKCSGNKAYGWLRKRHALAASKRQMGNTYWLGKKHTEEWKAEMSKAMTGRKMPRDGVEKLAAQKRGIPLSQTHRDRIGAANRGLRRTADAKEKIAASKRGKPLSEEHRAKIGLANSCRVLSDDTKMKMSLAHTGVPKGPCSPETRAKISAAHRARRLLTSL